MELRGIMLRKVIVLFAICLTACGYSEKVAMLEYDEDARKAGILLLIDRIEVGYPNSAGGVIVSIGSTNISNKKIKYIYYTVEPYNAVGDIVQGEISRRSSKILKETGPIYASESSRMGYWSNVWYNHSIRCIKITEVNVIYSDQTSRNFTSSSVLDKMMRPGVNNNLC